VPERKKGSDLASKIESGSISEEAIAALRKEIGQESALPQFNYVASEDAIRHFTHGRGDDNPLFCNSEYASRSKYGAIVAPATFVLSCGFPRSRGLPGVHGLFTGIDLICHQPIKVGSSVTATTALHDLTERHGQYAGRQYQQTSVTRYAGADGTILSTLYSHAFRMDRNKASQSEKFSRLERQTYSDEDLAEVEQAYEREVAERRGRAPRYWDDVEVGETLERMAKGPLSVTDNIAFLIGFGTVFIRAHRQWHEFRKRHPGAGVRDKHGVWDVPERVHWDEDLAKSIGMPGPYDYGPQRIAWFDHRISDWMGDDGWLQRLSVSLRAPNFVGDITWIHGAVKDKRKDDVVIVELHSEDQRGRTTATAEAEIRLPRK
jgi:acyl dehydratase